MSLRPYTNWRSVSSFPYHFHDGYQDNVAASSFALDFEQGFREFIDFISKKIA
ncbi:MAG: hypothetical protein L6404_08110 [Candidatus Omnitrophica bacterium]|nr:hypothetical protein [Candidatus Omnitrophota bacterium]